MDWSHLCKYENILHVKCDKISKLKGKDFIL